MDFGEVLGRAWKITWKYKVLWIFGILAGCSQGGGGGGGSGSSGSRVSGPDASFPQLNQYSNQFSAWIASHLWVVAVFVLVIFLIAVAAAMLGAMGRIGLIKGTFKAEGGAEHLGLAELWDESRPYFWRIFLLALLVGLAAVIVVLTLIALGIGLTVVTFGLGALCLVPLVCLMVPALWLLSIVVQQAETAIVLENLGIMDGLQRGWDVFKKNVGPMLIMWLILAVIGIVVGIALAIPILVVWIPAAFAFVTANQSATNISWTPLIIATACCALYFPVLLVLNGILMTYLQSAWTLTFMRLTKPKDNTESTPIQAPAA